MYEMKLKLFVTTFDDDDFICVNFYVSEYKKF
jgi:hypothetical protein